jgi:hypothetical protein
MSMFQLREDHMNAFQETALENFQDRGVRYLRSQLPNETADYSDDQLRQRVRECVARAQPYGLTSERQVMSFAVVTYISGENFDTSADCDWAPAVLQNPDYTGDVKAAVLISFAYSRGGPA